MTASSQDATIFAGEEIALEFTVDDLDTDPTGATALPLTGKIIKYSLVPIKSTGTKHSDPVLALNNTDNPAQVVFTDAANGVVEVRFLNADTSALANKISTDYYHQVEIFDAGETKPIMGAEGKLTIKPNNADTVSS